MHEGCKTHWPCLFNWVSKLLWASEFFRVCLQLRRRKGQQKRRKRKNAHGCSHLQGSSPWLSSVCTTGRRTLHSSSTFAADLPAVEVMMFGMTGAGKSALGNLIAGQNIFDSGSLTPDRCRMMALGPTVINIVVKEGFWPTVWRPIGPKEMLFMTYLHSVWYLLPWFTLSFSSFWSVPWIYSNWARVSFVLPLRWRHCQRPLEPTNGTSWLCLHCDFFCLYTQWLVTRVNAFLPFFCIDDDTAFCVFARFKDVQSGKAAEPLDSI